MARSPTVVTGMFVLTIGTIGTPIHRIELSTEINLGFVSIRKGRFLFSAEIRFDSIRHDNDGIDEGELVPVSK
jgi:hypothetical protein